VITRRYFVIFIAILSLFGCDRFYSYSHTSNFPVQIEHRCIEDALQSVASVSNIKYEYHKGDSPVTISGVKDADSLHYYFYNISKLKGHVLLSTNFKNESNIRQHYSTYGIKEGDNESDILMDSMAEIEAAIEAKCNIK
jgi:hypothetical protein